MNLFLQIKHSANAKITVYRRTWLLLAFFFTTVSYAQLPNFTLNITATDETCPGNGSIGFSVSGTDPAATITYQIYQLPNTTTPIAFPTGNTISGLVAGDYQIVATQTLGTQSNTQIWTETLTDEITPLAYTIGGTAVTCGNNGTMTVSTFAGAAVSYEIISGPVTAPLQTSNVFTGLSVGEYQVRVFDNCGQGWVTTHTLFASLGTSLSWTESDQSEVVDCNQITITNTLAPELNAAITFPITITYTIHPPGGGPDIVDTIYMAGGDISGQEFTTVIPYYSNQVYSYNVTVTDACGNGFYFDNILINKPFLAEFRAPPAECGEFFLVIAMSNFMPPVTVNFTNSPAGFNPVSYNSGYPGPFSQADINFGDSNNGVPFGSYTAEVTDGCGRTKIVQTTLEPRPPSINVEPTPNEGCNSGTSTVKFRLDANTYVTASIISGPASFSATYPVDVIMYIDSTGKVIEIANMPAGDYVMIATDNCGNNYHEPFTVPPMATQVSVLARPGCEYGKGSIRIRGSMVNLTSVVITAAPADYTATLPEDVSYNISASFPDTFSMNGFPAGDYTFHVIDNCGLPHDVTVTVIGYEVTKNDYGITPHCGSFDLFFDHVDNSMVTLYFLQKYDPVTGQWGHPQTGSPYLPGMVPNSGNSYGPILNPATTFNISYLGDFRIIKRFETFENGSMGLFKICTEVVREFTFLNELQITNIRKATCNGINTDVSVTANGVPPFTYYITSMNGGPFNINNGNDPVFHNLQPAVYNFEVHDSCGNIANTLTDVAQLPSLVIIHQPGPLIECDGVNQDHKAEFNLAGQNSAVLGGATPSDFTITYHLTPGEAATGANPLPDVYPSETRTIYCRMQYNSVSTCFDVTSFEVTVNTLPTMGMALTQGICPGAQTVLTADAGFDTYLWSTGETAQSITVNLPGIYTLDVTLTQNGINCTATYAVTVVPSKPAEIRNIETTDWTYDENTISVILEEPGNYTFSLDNIHFQASNTFYGLEPGLYTVYVKDNNGCDSTTQEVYLLAYPRYFTPNGDGFHDYWQIYFAKEEPALKVYVFDRFGKLITGFGAESPGWDGRYNERELPSTDYWFLVIRQDGTEKRGHFAMKR